ncbi:MAG: hypothetical protein R3C18_19270 [Planctomycetaceae bacterium]
MSTSEPVATAGFPWKAVSTVTALVLAAFAMFIAVPEADDEPVITDLPDQAGVKQQLRSEQELTRIFSGMRAGYLDSTLNRQAAIDDLNRWLDEFPLKEDQVLTQDSELLKSLLPPELQDPILGDRFTPSDAGHIRMSIMSSEIVSAIKRRVKQEVSENDPAFETAVVTAAFYFVWQNVAEDQNQKLLTPYEVFIYGRGTPLDRIWCFAELVRQLSCDTVLIAPSQSEQPLPPFVGVLTTGGEFLLFEPSLGIPLADLSVSPTTVLPDTPATLKQVLETPDFFDHYHFEAVENLGLREFTYPVKHENLASIEVLIAGHPSQWAPRMATVEFRTPSDQEALFYAGLGKNSLRQNGAFERIVETGTKNGWWKPENVHLWLDPLGLEFQFEQGRNAPATVATHWQQINQIMQGPEVVNAAGDGVELAQRSLEDVRIEQLTGKSATALSHLLPIRNARHRYQSDINLYAADFATFRTAQCQMEIGQWAPATQTLVGYLQDTSGPQNWSMQAVDQIALIKMQELKGSPPGNIEEAKSLFVLFSQVPEKNARQLFLLHYWARLLQETGHFKDLDNIALGSTSEAEFQRPPSPALPMPLIQ